MANILKEITLTEQGANAGPLYDVYYSIDCEVFILAVDGNSVYLPSVGSTTLVTVPEETGCIRLINKTEVCNSNSVTEGTPISTTTTTTTAGPTTTTTTNGGTTTTSTTTCTTLYEVQVYVSIFPCFSTFGPCCGTTLTTRWLDAATLATATTIYSNNNCSPSWNQGIVTYISDGTNCRSAAANTGVLGANSTCSVTCPTTTTTTTTTTQAPTKYKVELCGGGEGPYVITIQTGETPSGINQALKLYKADTPFNGIKCWDVLENPTTDPLDFSNVSVNSLSSNCTECLPTTTTTQAPTTTTTLAPSSCWRAVNETESSLNVDYTNPAGQQPIIGVPGASTVWFCAKDGTTPTADAGITLIYCGTICTNDSNCINCNTTTTTTTAAPTTTTTQAALNFDLSSVCNSISFGETPTSTVSATSFTGGSGVYQITQVLYLTQTAALNGTYIDTGTPPVDFFSVENGTWWVAIRDKNNPSNKLAKSITLTCPEATTTTTTSAGTTTTTTAGPTTTTTTTAAPTRYKVELCGGGEGPFVVTLASGDTPSGIGQAYKLSAASTPFNGVKCWEILENPTTDPVDYPNVAFGSVYSNCSECIGTTTTTTAAPTTTTTTIAPTTTTTTLSLYSCNDGIVQGSYSGTSQYTYPDRSVSSASNQYSVFYWVTYDRPNRFTLIDDSGTIYTTGWVGYANYPGPWGDSLNTATTGNQYFGWGSTSGRKVRVDAGNGSISDAYEWQIVCASATTTTSTTTTTTTTAAPTTTTTSATQTVQGVFGYMEPCIGGTIDDHMGASVYTNTPVLVDTMFEVYVYWVFPGNSCQYPTSQYFQVTIPAGETSSNFNACYNGAYFSSGATICSACIISCDNPSVTIGGFAC